MSADAMNSDQDARKAAVDRGMAFLNQLAESGQSLEQYTAAQPQAAVVQVADDVHVVGSEALKAGRMDIAQFAASVGGTLNIKLGRMDKALEDRDMYLQVEYQRATTPAEYESVRGDFLELAGRADAAGETRRALQARAFAIQAGYFGAEASPDPNEQARWIRRALGDFLDTLEASPKPMPADDATFLMDFTFAPLDLATSRMWLEQRSVDALLRDIARAVEAHIPADAPLSQDPARDAAIAQVLARLPAEG